MTPGAGPDGRVAVSGVVTRVEAGIARIECSAGAQPACATCASGRGCGWQRPAQPRHIDLQALQGSRCLEPGDRLELQVDDNVLLRAACRLYLPPLAGVLAGPAVLRWLELEQGVLPLMGATAGLAVGAAVAWAWTRTAVPIRWRALDGPAS